MGNVSNSATADERLTTVGLLFESAAGLRRVFSRQLEDAGANTQQAFDILIRLARSDEQQMRMSELAAQASLTPSGLTRAVDRLQDQGLVERRTCPEDRRGSFAQLTPAGSQLMSEAIPAHVAQIDRVLNALFTPEEEVVFASMLRRLRDYTHEQNIAAGCNEVLDGGCPDSDGADPLIES